MSDKKKINPWIFTIILGVVTLLFALYAVQAQTEEVKTLKKISDLEVQLTQCEQRVTEAGARVEQALREAEAQAALAAAAQAEARKR